MKNKKAKNIVFTAPEQPATAEALGHEIVPAPPGPADLAKDGDTVPTNTPSPAIGQVKEGVTGTPFKWEIMNYKPVIYRYCATVLSLDAEAFRDKLLGDGLTFNLGDGCAFRCPYCYVESVIYKLDEPFISTFNLEHGTNYKFQDLVIRRQDSLTVLKNQLVNADGTPIYNDPNDNRVVFTATLVDPAANMKLLRETAAACNLILDNTGWRIRLLSKCALLKLLISKKMIPEKHHHRLIFGFSTGTLDDKLAGVIEPGTSPPSMRLKALHWLQDHDIRTYGMICPSLPQDNYDKFSKEICKAIRVEKCEHVWGEVMNVRAKSKEKTIVALRNAGYTHEADRLEIIFDGDEDTQAWEDYSRNTFLAHCKHVPAGKLRFLQYVKETSVGWWADRRADGAVPIGVVAQKHLVLAGGESAPRVALPALMDDDIHYLDAREKIVHSGIRASIAAARALHEIHAYKNGLLWKKDYLSFDLYCQAKWRYAKAHGYRLVDAGRFVAELENRESPHGDSDGEESSDTPAAVKMPVNEGQIRPLLAVVPDDHQVACWNDIVTTHDPAGLTSAMVEDLAKAYVKKLKIPVASKKAAKIHAPDRDVALRELAKLRKALDKLPDPKRFEQLLKGIIILVKQGATDDVIDVTATVIEPGKADAPELPDKPDKPDDLGSDDSEAPNAD